LTNEPDFDWDMKVELLEIELEALRKEIERIAEKFDRFDKYLKGL
jgi:chaperonin cofactor prefoldin